jgi:predicted DNA binding CopG/RHH family protein
MDYKLDDEELEFLESVKRGEWQSIENMEDEIRKYVEYAKNSLDQIQKLSITVDSEDLELLKRKAVIDGIPYQTLISSILHKYVNGTL